MAESPQSPPSWQAIDQLVAEDKVQAALTLVTEQLAAARDGGDMAAWTHALIKAVQLRTALHGYETAVRLLREEPWPTQEPYRAVVGLFYAETLVHYLRIYSWEIGSRERQVVSGPDADLDLKRWTRNQLVAEVQRAFAEVWAQRATWGDASLGVLAPYVEQNDYPARIRGTLRDTVSYLWVQQLSDTALWPAGTENDVYTLATQALIDGTPTQAESPHPLARLAAVLGDLEAWHAENARPEAAFEARRERLARLTPHLTLDDDRAALRRDLETQMDRLGRRYPWWSMGMASLAEMIRDLPAPDALARALDVAQEGAQVHPGSAGSVRCQHLADGLLAPSYQLTGMAVDGAQRRSLALQHKNLDTVHFRAYALDLEARLKQPLRGGLLPSYQEIPALLRTGKPVASWTTSLPATPDLRRHRTDVVPPLDARGLYVIVASARSDFREGDNDLQAVAFQRSDLVLLTRSHDNRHEVTVRSGTAGTVVADAEVALIQLDHRQGISRTVARETTDAEGRVAFTLSPNRHEQHLVLARHGDDRVLDDQRLNAYRPARSRSTINSLVYTDRSIYRPGQSVLWKVVAYQRPAQRDPTETVGRLAPVALDEVEVILRDANGQEVARALVDTNEFGSASGSFAIPAGRTLGSWQLTTSASGRAQIAVEEYKRPTFEVTIDDPDAPLRLNRPATLRGHASYYFGLPVTAGTVRWRITREPQWPWRYDAMVRGGAWWWPTNEAPQTIAAGEAVIDADGAFEVTFSPDADERLADSGITYRYRLTTEVTDEGGETREASRSYRLGFVAVEAFIDQEPGFFTAHDDAELTVRRQSLDGVARTGRGTWTLFALDQPSTTGLPAEQPLATSPANDPETKAVLTEGDQRRPRYAPSYDPRQILRLWPNGRRVDEGTVVAKDHDDAGAATLALGRLAPGAYRLRYRTEDAFGAAFETNHELIVAGDDVAGHDATLALPALLLVEQSEVVAGQDLRVLAHSGLEDQPLLVEVLRGSTVVHREAWRAQGAPRLISVPVTDADRGGLEVRLTAVRDHQWMMQANDVAVPWDNRALTVTLESFRDLLRPGTQETWRVTMRGAEGPLAAGAAELLATMYDRSLDLFARHQPPSLDMLTPTRSRGRGVHVNLGVASRIWSVNRGFASIVPDKVFQPDRLIFLDGWSIGGPGGGGPMLSMQAVRRSGVNNKMQGMAMAMPEAAESVADMADAAPADGAAADGAAAPSEDRDASTGDSEPALRTDFAETAFWEPHLISDEDGAVSFSFTVPDAVTEWNIWLHAITRDLRAHSVEQRTRTVKELLVRPYVPRFLREGDRATIEVAVNNAGDQPLDGTVRFEIIDPVTEASRAGDFGLASNQLDVPFSVDAKGSTSLAFPLVVPAGVGPIAFRVVGRAGDWSDGELRPVPVLPGRFHLAQSRFAALRGSDRDDGPRQLHFADLAANDDPSRINDRLVVTIDGQLFYSVLNAVPYLMAYPYENTEATLNRFVTTGILSRLFDEVPSVARMAATLAKRDTRLASFDGDDANRTMALEETPWLRQAHGGTNRTKTGNDGDPDTDPALIRVLDPRIATATREAALATLRRDRNADGGFPWFPGGPSSPWITSYVVHGFAKALELGVDVPQDLVVDAFRYLETYYRNDLTPRATDDRAVVSRWHEVTYLNYILSSFPDISWTGGVFTDDDRTTMLERSFRHWRAHSPMLKGYLALTLNRAGRRDDARLVFDSVLDSATTTDELGTFWAPEDRAWLWYNDTVEGHATVLRTMTELDPDDPRRAGLVQWLLLNKHLNHWQSTRTTAEVIYALTHHLRQEGQLESTEAVTVAVGTRQQRFVFEPDAYTGANNQLVVDGPALDPETMATVTVDQETPGLMFASATWHFSTETLPAEARGDFFHIERRYFRRANDGAGFTLEPLTRDVVLAPGDQVEVQVSIRTKHAAEYVHLRDPRAAGFEPESHRSGWRWDLGIGWYEEVRDSGTNFFFERLPAGEYTFTYRLRANLAGTFKTAPAVLQSVYAPEFVAYSAGDTLQVSATSDLNDQNR